MREANFKSCVCIIVCVNYKYLDYSEKFGKLKPLAWKIVTNGENIYAL